MYLHSISWNLFSLSKKQTILIKNKSITVVPCNSHLATTWNSKYRFIWIYQRYLLCQVVLSTKQLSYEDIICEIVGLMLPHSYDLLNRFCMLSAKNCYAFSMVCRDIFFLRLVLGEGMIKFMVHEWIRCENKINSSIEKIYMNWKLMRKHPNVRIWTNTKSWKLLSTLAIKFFRMLLGKIFDIVGFVAQFDFF